MSTYEKPEVYRIVATAGGVVSVVLPGGITATVLEESYPSASAAAAAIADAIKDGMPALEVWDETASAGTTQAVSRSLRASSSLS